MHLIPTLLGRHTHLLTLITLSWCLKLLLLPAYYSTDFAVHQNWLRITHQSPLQEWYYNTESKWTLDYPPFFAYFQWVLGVIGYAIDPAIVETINQLPQTIAYQRITVILTDLFYLYSLLLTTNNTITLKLVLAYLWIPFLLLDNIHFQYNIAMQSILIISVYWMNHGNYLRAAFFFAILLNFKHIYLYCAPAFFVYLLKEYVFGRGANGHEERNGDQAMSYNRGKEPVLWKFLKLAGVTVIPFIVSFGPFFIVGGIEGIKQIFSRLFPFSRGLIHQYWAPNFWALYYFVDKMLVIIGFKRHDIQLISSGAGVDGGQSIPTVNVLKILPEISPTHTIILILLFLAPIIFIYFISKRKPNFTQLVSLSGLIFFYFGFHVHQKAIVPYINLLFLFSPSTMCLNASIFVNIVNLVPLLIEPKQKLFCIVVCLLWIALWDYLDQHKREEMAKAQERFIRDISITNAKDMALLYIEYIVEISGMMIVVFHLLVHPFIHRKNIEFLPFMMNSVWAAVFNSAWFGFLYWKFIDQYGIHPNRSRAIEQI